MHGFFGVDSFEVGGVSGRDLPDSDRWVRVGMNAVFGRLAIRRADGSGGTYGFELVDNGSKLSITRRGETSAIGALRFRRTRPGSSSSRAISKAVRSGRFFAAAPTTRIS